MRLTYCPDTGLPILTDSWDRPLSDRLAGRMLCSAKGGGGGGGGSDDDDDSDDDSDDEPKKKTVLTMSQAAFDRRLKRASIKRAAKEFGVTEAEMRQIMSKAKSIDDDDDDDVEPKPRRSSRRRDRGDDRRSRARSNRRSNRRDDDDGEDELDKLLGDLDELADERDRYKHLAEKGTQTAKVIKSTYDRKMSDLETEYELKLAAMRAGIDSEHVDYAVNMVAKHVSKLDDDKVEKFDPESWLKEKVKKRPYLAKPEEVPANTGTDGDNADDGADADESAAEKGDDGKGSKGKPKPADKKDKGTNFDALSSDKSALKSRLAELGLRSF